MTELFAEIPEDLKTYFDQCTYPWEIFNGLFKKFFDGMPKENKILGKVSPQAILEGEHIFIDEGAVVEPTAFIKGPCYIGKGTEVRHGAYLRGYVYAGQNCVLGHTTEVKHSILMNEAKAGHFNYIGDSILGSNVNLGAGTKLANLKVIPGNIQVKIDGKTLDTNLRKLGGILGDKTETGCNSVINPGTILGKRSIVFPNASAFGVHFNKVKIK